MLKQVAKDQVLELNAAHPIVVNLNQLRKSNRDAAKLVSQQLLDNVMVQSGIPFDLQAGCDRQFDLLGKYLDLAIQREGGASRSTTSENEPEIIIEDVPSSSEPRKSALK